MSAPLQVIAMGFPPGGGMPDRVLGELDRVQARAGVRVLDMLVATTGGDGSVVESVAVPDEDFGALIARLFPLGTATGMGDDDGAARLWTTVRSMPPGTTVVFLLLEHRWARGVVDEVGASGGSVLTAGFLTPELGLLVDAEVMAMEDAARSIAQAQAAEADAHLRAAVADAEADAAVAEADAAVAASQRVRSAAAAQALQALADAGVVERAALHEAADALTAAGLLIAAADDTAQQAVDVDTAVVAAADEASEAAIAADSSAVAAADEKTAAARQAASITPAEIRVLRYLPTTLTFALIADHLGISRAAAKSRAARAYRKLDVHTRGDAVDRARALRVIPG